MALGSTTFTCIYYENRITDALLVGACAAESIGLSWWVTEDALTDGILWSKVAGNRGEIIDKRVKKIYDLCPRSVQTLGINAAELRTWSTDHSRSVNDDLDLMRRAQSWNEDDLFEYQSSMLRRMVRYAYQEVPFYHRLYKEHGVDVSSIRTVKDLPKLPVVTKSDVYRHAEDFVPRKPIRYRRSTTGGTTGIPLEVRLSHRCYSISRAAQLLRDEWAGHHGEMMARFVGDRPVSGCGDQHLERRSYVNNRLIFPPYCISPRTFPRIMNTLTKHEVQFIQCYPSAGYILAKLLELDDRRFPLKALLYGSEPLYDHQLKLFEDRFQTKVFGFYGQAEAVIFAMQCERGCYHLAAVDGIMEVVSGDEAVSSGERGHTVGTTLCNFAMPLIRYRLDDYTGFRGEGCECGRGTPTIYPVETRSNDLLVTPSGRILPPIVFGGPILATPNIIESQVVQKAIDRFVVRVVPTEKYTDADETLLLNAYRERLDDGISISIEKVDSIHHSSSFKKRWAISELNEDVFERAMKENKAS
jgi:phenylacetate-CoA ligase